MERVAQLVSNMDNSADSTIDLSTRMFDLITGLPDRLRVELGTHYTALLDRFKWDNLRTEIFNLAKTQLTNSLAHIMPRLAAKFIPGVGILTSVYQGIKFLDDNKAALVELFRSFVNGLGELAASVTDPSRLTNFTNAIVNAVSDQGVQIVLTFAADQLGLQTLRQNIKNAVEFIPNRVNDTMRQIVSAIATRITAALPGGAIGLYAGLVGSVRTFTYRNQEYKLWVAQPRTGVPQVKLAQGPRLIAVLTTAMFNNTIRPGSSGRLAAIIHAANTATRDTNLRAATQNVALLTTAETNLVADITANACSALGCFAAGTKLWTPDGYRNIESILPGELIYSRDEFDPEGAIEAKHVEEVFRRFAPILNLHLNGQVIRTTGEHPFYVYNKGWTKASAISVPQTATSTLHKVSICFMSHRN